MSQDKHKKQDRAMWLLRRLDKGPMIVNHIGGIGSKHPDVVYCIANGYAVIPNTGRTPPKKFTKQFVRFFHPFGCMGHAPRTRLSITQKGSNFLKTKEDGNF